MISLFKKPVLFFFIIFIILNSLSIFFYYSKQNSHVIKKSYSLDYELLNLVKEIDYIISVISNNPISSSKIVGMDEIEQLYFKLISTQSILNKDDKLIN